MDKIVQRVLSLHNNRNIMNEYRKKKKFLEVPRYGGGKEEFRKFIAENLRYPKEALEAGVEGKVLVEYEIDDNGFVHNPRVLNGIGYGCDEEAVRVISLLRFKKVKNRGMRLKVTTKTYINFKLPATKLQYTITYKQETKKPQVPEKPAKEKPVTYEYTIRL